jgi:parallel beta-helix repeat protein
LENCNINNNNYGVYAAAASNPVFNQCDFNDNYYFALANVDKSFVINAANCWWGSNLGPVQTNTPGNGTSVQELITTSVDYQPFKTNGGVSPEMGDVSLNGAVQAFDASLVLQHVVGSITLNVTQQEVADVSAEAGITAYDASLILQYVVGMIQYFPAELLKSGVSFLSDPVLSVGSAAVMSKTDVDIPVRVIHESGMVSGDIYLKYDPDYLQVKRVTTALTGMTMFYGIDSINGILTIALAGTCPLAMDTTLALITFHARCPAGTQVSIPVRVNTFLANETDLTNGSINGIVTITNPANGIAPETENMPGRMFPVYPNPTSGNATLTYVVNKNHSFVTIEIYNMTGMKVATLITGQFDKGKYTVPVLKQGIIPDSGAYLIRMTVNGYSQTQILQIAK